MPPKRSTNGRFVAATATATATPDDATAVLAFLSGWRQQQEGTIVAGSSLIVRYEPERLADGEGGVVVAAATKKLKTPREIIGYARFLPGGQIRHATLRGRRAARKVAAEIAVPPETREVELWFQCTDADGVLAWDSRFGENYRFAVAHPSPRHSLAMRANTIVDGAVITVADEAAIKLNAFESHPGRPAGGASLQTSLHVAARVRKSAAVSAVWVDVHCFDGDAERVHGDSLPLRRERDADDTFDLFVLDGALYQGTIATPGSAMPRPDVRSVQYRVYCATERGVLSDGELHRCYLKTDALSS